MLNSLPASTIWRVTWTSSADGVGSPLGWLWATIRAAAFSLIASRNSSPTDHCCIQRADVDCVPLSS